MRVRGVSASGVSCYEWCELFYFDLYDLRNKVKVNFIISFGRE